MARSNKGSWFTKHKMRDATVIENTKTGRQKTLLTPTGRFNRYGVELECGANAHTGELLTEGQKGYRAGYRAALAEQAKIFKKKHGK